MYAYHRFNVRRPHVTLVRYARGMDTGFPRSLSCMGVIRLTRTKRFKGMVVSNPLSMHATYRRTDNSVGNVMSPVGKRTSILVFPGVRSNGTFCGSISLFTRTRVTNLLRKPVYPIMLPSHDSSNLSGCCDVTVTYLRISKSYRYEGRVGRIPGGSWFGGRC